MRTCHPIIAGSLLLSALLLAGCGGKQPEAATMKPALTVQVVVPREESWPGQLPASGPVAAWQEASIGTELAGARLEEVRVNVGDVVKKGQVLAHFNEDSIRANLAALDAGVLEASAALDKARADADSADQLQNSGALSQQDIRALHTQAAVAEARLNSAKAQRDVQRLHLQYANVVAPDDGVISARTATVGAVANPGSELFRLIRGGRLEWRAEVRADALPLLKRGTPVSVHLPDGSNVEGSVRQIAPSVAADTLNGMVYVDLPANSRLAAGMFVSGEFELSASPALAVPESALVFRNNNRYVMLVGADNRIKEAKIVVGRRRGSDVEIQSGIDPAARLVRSGGAFLNDGDLVQVAKP